MIMETLVVEELRKEAKRLYNRLDDESLTKISTAISPEAATAITVLLGMANALENATRRVQDG
jgi:hypothetical protein